MNRPILFVTIAFMAGIALAESLKIHYTVAFPAAAIAMAAYLLFGKKNDNFVFALFACLGALLFSYQNTFIPPNHILNRAGENIAGVRVLVIDMPEESENRVYFTANLESIIEGKTEISNIKGRVRVTIEKTLGFRPEYGDIVYIKGRLKEPEQPKNAGEFDYKKYLAYKQVYHVIYAKDTACEKQGKRIDNYFKYFSYKAKAKLLAIIYDSLPAEEARILDGLMLGNQRAIPQDIYDKFKITGTVHILAVSGMNVGLIAFFVFLLLKLMRVKRKAGAAMTILLITAFAIITGAGASIIRATIMGYVVLAAILIERDADIYNSLATAAFIILLFNPSDLFDAGFQLSFLATFGIIYYSEWMNSFFPAVPDAVKATLTTTVAAQVFLTPVMANTFHQVSLVSVLANLFIVPLSGVISILGFTMWILGTFSAAAARVFGASIWALIKVMMFITDFMSCVPYAAISLKTVPFGLAGLYYIFFLALPHADMDIKIRGAGLKWALCGVTCVWAVLYVTVPSKPALYALAGRGINAEFIQTADNKKILLLGCDDYRHKNAVRNTVIPFLRYKGINNIDALVLYSVVEKENTACLFRNFMVKGIYSDMASFTGVSGKKNASLIEGDFRIKEGERTFIYFSQYAADITSGDKEMLFARTITAEMGARMSNYIYCCDYSGAQLALLSKNNYCIINPAGSGGFRKKPQVVSAQIWDLNAKGMFEKPL